MNLKSTGRMEPGICKPTIFLAVPWLLASVAAALLSSVSFWAYALELRGGQLWLIPLALAASTILLPIGAAVERYGLLALLPAWGGGAAPGHLQRPLFEILRALVAVATRLANNCVRVAMLVCLELDEAQRKDVLDGLDVSWRVAIFQRPLEQLLPWPARRFLLGRQSAARHGGSRRGTDSKHGETEAVGLARRMRTRTNSSLERSRSLVEIVRGMGGMEPYSDGPSFVPTVEKIVAAKVIGGAVSSARVVAASAGAQAAVLSEGLRDAAADPKAQVTAASAVGGAAALGAGGGAAGLVSGGLVGAAVGVVPAFLTFGLSIPIGAVIGGCMGLCAGTAIGGAAGFVGGGAAGFRLYGWRERIVMVRATPAVGDGSAGDSPRSELAGG